MPIPIPIPIYILIIIIVVIVIILARRALTFRRHFHLASFLIGFCLSARHFCDFSSFSPLFPPYFHPVVGP